MANRGEEAWKYQSACRGMDVNLFIPERGQTISAAARLACAQCPVQLSCLDYAVTNHLSGMYADTTDKERKRLRREGYAANSMSARHLVKRLPDVITESF